MRLKIRTVEALALPLILLSIACGGPGGLKYTEDFSNTDNGGPGSQPAALQILQTNCAACHGGATTGEGGIYDILNREHLVAQGLIVPGSPDTSPLFNTIAAGSMPPTGPLADGDIATIRQWISDGAPRPVGPTPAPTPAPTLEATYQSLRANIFVPKCLACHGAQGAQGGVRLDTFTNVRREVNVNNPASSDLYQALASGDMPQGGPPLASSEVVTVLQWIQNGALNN